MNRALLIAWLAFAPLAALAQDGVVNPQTDASKLTTGTLAAARTSLAYIIALSGGASAQAQNTTQFYGTGLTSGGITGGGMTIPVAVTAGNLYVSSSAPPGVGQTYTATLYNAGTTVVTCTISGNAASSCNDTTHTAGISAGTQLYVQVVSSATAASATFSFGFTLTK